MIHITIENKGYAIIVHRERLKDARHEWTAANQFDVFIKGAFKPLEYDVARNLALQVIIDANLPVIALKRISKPMRSKILSSDTKKMF